MIFNPRVESRTLIFDAAMRGIKALPSRPPKTTQRRINADHEYANSSHLKKQPEDMAMRFFPVKTTQNNHRPDYLTLPC
jgi:hypothetical protein